MGFFSDVGDIISGGYEAARDIEKEVFDDIGDIVQGIGSLFGGGDDDASTVGSEGLETTAKSFEEIAAEQWAIYKKHYAPYEIETMISKRAFLPEFARQTTEGIDVGRRQDEAAAEVMAQTKLGEGRRRREISRYGIDPSSSFYGNVANIQTIETSKAVAGARTAAKTQAESEQYARLGAFLEKPTPDPYARTLQAYSGAAGSYAALAANVVDKPSPWSGILGLVGGAAGAYFGGPAGAAVGYGIGSQTGAYV